MSTAQAPHFAQDVPRDGPWTCELIIQRIQQWVAMFDAVPTQTDWSLRQARRAGNATRIRRLEEANGYWPSEKTVIRLFGSWGAAITAANVQDQPTMGRVSVPRERAIKELRQWAEVHGPPTREAFSFVYESPTGPRVIGAGHIATLFGGWLVALEAAGVAREPWTREAIIARVHEWTAAEGGPPLVRDWNPRLARAAGLADRAQRFDDADGHWPSADACAFVFGSWNEMLQAAGVPVNSPRVQWTVETAADALRRWARENDGLGPRAADWNGGGWPTPATIHRLFGSWAGGLEYAGVERRPSIRPYIRYTDDELLDRLAEYTAQRGGVPPRHRDWPPASPGWPAATTIVARFGSWDGFLAAGGFVPSAWAAARWPRRHVVQSLLLWAADHDGYGPQAADWALAGPLHPNADTVRARFRTWAAALKAAGLRKRPRDGEWTRQRIIKALKRWAAENEGSGPRTSDWQFATDWHPGVAPVLRKFDSWEHALKAAGLHGRPLHRVWTAEQIIKALKEWAAAHDGYGPRTTDWRIATNRHPSLMTVRMKLGSWENALRMADLKPRPHRRMWPDERILEQLRDWAEAHDGNPPQTGEWIRAGIRPTVSTILARYGSWDAALRAAGLLAPDQAPAS